MTIDRERLRIDLLTSVVGFGLATGSEAWAWWAAPRAERVGVEVLWVWVWQLMVLVGPQLVQTVVGQVVFTRLRLNVWARGLVIAEVWFGSLCVWYFAELVSLALLSPWGLALVGVVQLALIRLVVRAVVRARVRGRARRRPRGATAPAAR